MLGQQRCHARWACDDSWYELRVGARVAAEARGSGARGGEGWGEG